MACVPAGADAGPKSDASGFAGSNPHAAAQREHRIKNRSRRVRQRAGVHDGHRIAQIAPAAQKSRSIGLELQAADGLSLQRADMSQPELRIGGFPAAAGGEQCAAVGDEFRPHEHFGEGGVGGVGGGRRQHHFGISRQFDFTHAGSLIGHRYPADLRIVLG